MFNNQRYVTKGIIADIPPVLQAFIWHAIETMEIKKNYLQVFKLYVDNGKQHIVHTQEQPEYKQEYTFSTKQPTAAVIFVIDDITHSTMLLSSEY